MNWQWLLNDILKLFKWYSNERKAVGSGHVRKDRAHRFFVRVVFVLFETRRFCKVERFVFPDLLVRGDDAEVYFFFQNAVATDTVDVDFQF